MLGLPPSWSDQPPQSLETVKPVMPAFGLEPRPGRALVPDLAAGAGRGSGEGRDRGQVVVRLDLHQHMLQRGLLVVAGLASPAALATKRSICCLHHRGIVRIGHHRVLGAS